MATEAPEEIGRASRVVAANDYFGRYVALGAISQLMHDL